MLSILRGTVLNLKCVPSTITACRLPNRLTHSISRLRRRRRTDTTRTPLRRHRVRWKPRRHTRRSPRCRLKGSTAWTSGRRPWGPSACETGRMSLPRRSRPTRRTVLVWRTCATAAPQPRPANRTAAARPRRGGSRSSAGQRSRGTATKGTIPLRRRTTRRRLLIYHPCSRDPRPCRASSTRARRRSPRAPPRPPARSARPWSTLALQPAPPRLHRR